jgi:hypothetical protein
MADPYANPFDPGSMPGLHDFYLNSTPEAAFWDYLNRSGYGGQGRAVDKYAQGQQSRVYNQYSAKIANEPNLGFWDYLNREQPNFQADFMSQSPSQRGDTSGRSLTPRARFVNAY